MFTFRFMCKYIEDNIYSKFPEVWELERKNSKNKSDLQRSRSLGNSAIQQVTLDFLLHRQTHAGQQHIPC